MNRQSLQVVRVAYPNQTLDAALSAPTNEQLVIHTVAAVNGSSSSNDIGIGKTVNDSQSLLSVTVDGLSGFVELPISAATSIIGTSINDVAEVQSEGKFDLLAFDVSQAATGAVFEYEYWNGAWVPLTLRYTPDLTTTGIKVVLFDAPLDWAPDGNGMYAVRVMATTASSTALQVTAFKVANILSYREEVLPKGELLIRFETRQLLLQQGEDIIGFFAFPSPSNTMEASYQINP